MTTYGNYLPEEANFLSAGTKEVSYFDDVCSNIIFSWPYHGQNESIYKT